MGTPYEGKAANQVVYTLIMRMDGAVDIEQPFTIVYDDGTGVPSTTEYAVQEEVLTAIRERAAAAELATAERGAAEAGAEEAAAVESAPRRIGRRRVSRRGVARRGVVRLRRRIDPPPRASHRKRVGFHGIG